MLKFLKNLFGIGPYSESRPVDAVAPGGVPYKEPAATTPIPLVVETAPVLVVEAAPALVVETAPVLVVETAPEKKTRKPRTPKAETAVVEKAPANAKDPKLTVVKATRSKKA